MHWLETVLCSGNCSVFIQHFWKFLLPWHKQLLIGSMLQCQVRMANAAFI